MRVLVTGGAGFIGSNIVDGLINNGLDVAIIDNLSRGNKENVNTKASFYQMDILDPEIEKVFEEFEPEVVIHHAAQIDVQTSLKNPKLDANINIMGTIALLEKSVKYNIRKFIYASSAAIYGDPQYLGIDEAHTKEPMSFYGISKYVPEYYIRLFSQMSSLDYTILRYANVFGERQDPKGEGGVISIFIDKMLNDHSPVIYGEGSQTRDFIYVKDIVNANISAIYHGSKGTFNISCNQPTSVNELFIMLTDILGKNFTPIYQPARQGDIEHSYLANGSAKTILGWEPTFSLYDGLKETCKYYSSNIKVVM